MQPTIRRDQHTRAVRSPQGTGRPRHEIWVAVSGGENYGGCQVWLSSDGTNYKQIGEIVSPARHGFLTEPMASGTDPDCDVAPVDELLRARREYALPDARLLSVTNAKGYTSSAVDRAARHSVELVARDRLMRFLENG